MTEYEETKYICENSLLEAAHILTDTARNIRKQEIALDKVHKISMYMMSKYRESLIRDLKIDVMSKDKFFKDRSQYKLSGVVEEKLDEWAYDNYVFSLIQDAVAEEMNKKYPAPWYSYALF